MQLIIDRLHKSFGNNHVLKGATFTFQQGNIYALLGRNGSGKTTLFSLIAEEIAAEEGTVSIVDQNGEKRALTADDFFFMVANPALPNFLTGYEFVKFFLDVNIDKIYEPKTPDEYLEWIGFNEADRHRLIQGYSLGMKNKLQMLMFVMIAPPIILMDEPLTSLDVVMQLQIKNMIRSMRSEHIILFSTHILQLATDLCDEIVVLHNGLLTQLDHGILGDPTFEQDIIRILSDDEDAKELQIDKFFDGESHES